MLFGGAGAAWSLTARAQQPAMPVIGFLSSSSSDSVRSNLVAFRQALKESGFTEGQNVAIEYRFAENKDDRVAALAAELIRRQVTVIVTSSPKAALAAKTGTSTIPIVFSTGGDAVKLGLVTSLNRPGGNVTGVSFLINALGGKRLELLREFMPTSAATGVLINPTSPNAELELKDVAAAAHALGQKIVVLNASSEREIDAAFASATQLRAGALLVGADAFFSGQRNQLVELAARQAIPTLYPLREYVDAGGLMSYGTSLSDAFRQQGFYTGRILKGVKPADLPVVQSTKFELVINRKTSKALGLEVPSKLLFTADEVIE